VQQAFAARTPNERAKLEEQRNVLRRRLNTWMGDLKLYIPSIPNDHATVSSTEPSDATPGDHPPENMPLKLPSTLPASLLKSCTFNLVQIELRFRLAQADDSLSELRRLLRITMSLKNYRIKQVGTSQRAGTRARSLIDRFKDKISRCVERYRAAHNALLVLDPTGNWQTYLLQLKEEDVRAPGRRENESEGRRELSWIWLDARRLRLGQVSPSERLEPLSDEELDGCEHMNRCYIIPLTFLYTGLRCEWAKSKARADRWHEEAQLVKEEMRRVLAFLEWKAVWWTDEGRRDLDVRPDIADGIRAYAAKQASINRALAHSFKTRWSAFETERQNHEQGETSLTDGNEYTGEMDEYGVDTDAD
jgi:hypothetical protein